ncbi:MAG TPA: hypothetical protein VFI03_00270 [Solirubrobacterales bacterium]|nr:hypothetical protein [Solirubrobacterales bacterium]
MPLYGREHVERYRATNGEEGHGDTYTVIASKGGSDEPPAWHQRDTEREIPVVVLERA